jgi:hypothetical protein
VFPTRGVPGGWRDRWDDPDDSAELRAQAEAAGDRLATRALWIGLTLRQELGSERQGILMSRVSYRGK